MLEDQRPLSLKVLIEPHAVPARASSRAAEQERSGTARIKADQVLVRAP